MHQTGFLLKSAPRELAHDVCGLLDDGYFVMFSHISGVFRLHHKTNGNIITIKAEAGKYLLIKNGKVKKEYKCAGV